MTATNLEQQSDRQGYPPFTRRSAKLAQAGPTPGPGAGQRHQGSVAYVAGKHQELRGSGIYSIRKDLPADASQQQVEDAVANADPACTGFIVQLPLPLRLQHATGCSASSIPRKTRTGSSRSTSAELVLGEPGPAPGHP